MECILKKKAWLYRRFEVITPEGRFKVEYIGGGMGYEAVRVQDEVADRHTSLYWFVPRFTFHIGSLPSVLEVRVATWLQIKTLTLSVAGHTIYSE